MTESLLQIKNVSFRYPEETEYALNRVSLKVEKGEFFVLFGPSGCGKSTLLRLLKPALSPAGEKTGEILLNGKPIDELSHREESGLIGFVQQSPEAQTVTDRVWHELAFGLESMGCENGEIRRRVAETASFFGISDWFHRPVTELSGGQKQLLNLASVMVLRPELLLLDEPTSQLDPIAAGEFLNMLRKVNRELGTTVVLTEHRLEDTIPLADRVGVLEQGSLRCAGSPKEIAFRLREEHSALLSWLPASVRLWAALDGRGEPPVSVREGRQWLTEQLRDRETIRLRERPNPFADGETVLTAKDLHFRYEDAEQDTLRGFELSLRKGELYALLGSNGGGKSTALKVLAGQLTADRGTLTKQGTTALLPQDPTVLFCGKTVREDMLEVLPKPLTEEAETLFRKITGECLLSGLLERHPYDLSGGEQQRAALAKVLLTRPELLLLDEPTKGLDRGFQQTLGGILRGLQAQGVTILMVSHDVEFCAEWAERCGLLFDGSIASEDEPRQFFSGLSYYTTAAVRLRRGLPLEGVTTAELITCCGGEEKQAEQPIMSVSAKRRKTEAPIKPLPRWRRGIGLGALIVLLWAVFRAAAVCGTVGMNDLNGAGAAFSGIGPYLIPALVSFGILTAALARRGEKTGKPIRRKVSLRAKTAAVLVLLLVPLTLWFGIRFGGQRSYLAISLMILIECMLPFFLTFEGRKPQARELVLIAVLSAIGVAGRAAFFMLPECKPVLAIVILSGAAFGSETGFLVGAMTMLTSNALFGQGPWTPWQMFAMGLCGLLAGLLFRSGLLGTGRLSLCTCGFLLAVVVYGGLMNFASLLMAGSEVSLPAAAAMELTGLPVDCVHGTATVLFLALGGPALMEKLERVRKKYAFSAL